MKEVTYNSSLLKDSWNSNETVKPNNFNELSGAVKNVIANANDLAHNYLQQGKQYVAGDIVYSKNLNKGCYLVCTQGGATGDSEPQLINKNVGETVTDGAVTWTVQKVSNDLSLGGNLPEVFALLNSPSFSGTPTAPTAAAGTNTDQIASCAFVSQNSNPVGTIIAVAYTGVPEGYMHCNGAAVSRTTYANLFSKIGTIYGAGDGSTTFNLPNTVARFLEGGAGAGTYYEAGLPNITGNISAFKASISGAFVGSNNTNRYDGWNDNEDEYAVSTSFDASRSNSIYGASTTVQPPAMTVIYCIKY